MKGTLQRKPRFEWLSNNRAVRIREGLLHGASFVMALALMFAGHGQLVAHPLWSAIVLFCFGCGYAVASGVFRDAAYVYPTLGLWTFAFFLLCMAAGIPPLIFPVVATVLIWLLWAAAPKLEPLPHFSNAVYRCIFLTTVVFGFWAVFHHADQQQIPAAAFVLYGLSMVFFHFRRPRSNYAYSAGVYLAIGAFYIATVGGGPPVPGQSSLTVQSVVLLILLLAVLQHRRRPFAEALPFYVTGSAVTAVCIGMGLLGRQLLLDQLALTAITLGIPVLLFETGRNSVQPLPSRENLWLKSLQITSRATLYATMPLLVIAPMLELGHALWSSALLGLLCLLALVRRTAASARCAPGGTMHRLVFFAGMSAAWLTAAARGHSGPDAQGTAVIALLCTVVWLGFRRRDSLQRMAAAASDSLATLAILLVCIAVFAVQWNFTTLTAALVGLVCSLVVTRDKRQLTWSAAAAFGSVAIVVLTGIQTTLFSQWLVVELLACTCLLTAYFSERNALRAAICSAAALALAIPGMSIALRIGAGETSLMCLAGSLGVPFALAALFYHQKKTSAVWAVVAINFVGTLVLLWAGRLVSVTSLGVAVLILVPFLSAGWLKCRVWSYAASAAMFFAVGILLIAGNELGTSWLFMSVAALVCGMMLLVQSDSTDKPSQSAVATVGHAVAALMVGLLCQRNAGVMQWQTSLPLLIVGGCYLRASVQIPGQRSVAWVFLSLAMLPAAAHRFGSDTGTFLILPSVLVLAWATAGFKTRKTTQMDCCRTSALLGLLICLIGAVRGPDQASLLFIFCLAGFLVCLLARKERFYVHLVLLCLALMGYGWIQQFGSHFTQELYFYLLLILGLATVVEISPYLVDYLDSIAPMPFVRMLTLRGIGLTALVGILVAMTSATGFTLAITEHPIFCTSCHNMDKFYASWQHSSHQDVACVKCHYEPGFTAHVQGKIGALSQVVSFATHRYDVKPHAEVSNKSCLLCHSDIDQNTDAFFKDKVHFSHNLHHDAMVEGRELPCTVCHSQEAETQHMGLASSTCFLCHFYGEGPAAQKTSDCISCHGAPESKVDMGLSSFNHDSFFNGREVDCHVCHLSTTQGDALPHSVRCHSCHYGEQMEKLQEVSVEDVHEKHVHDEKMGCFECHGILKHGAPVKVAMTDAQQCASCHETDMQHSLQARMYMGTAVPDMPGEPNVMLEAGISCRHCHVEKTKLNRGGKEFFTHVSPAEYCATCHGDEDYTETFSMWQEDTKDALESTLQALEKATARLDSVPAGERAALDKRLKRAAELRQVVIDDGSMGIHSAFYAEEILDAAEAEIKAVEIQLEQMQ